MDKIRVLSLSEEDVQSLITIEDALEAVELALRERARGHAQMPPKVYLNYPQHNGDLRTMPVENLDISTVKVVSVHPETTQNPTYQQ